MEITFFRLSDVAEAHNTEQNLLKLPYIRTKDCIVVSYAPPSVKGRCVPVQKVSHLTAVIDEF